MRSKLLPCGTATNSVTSPLISLFRRLAASVDQHKPLEDVLEFPLLVIDTGGIHGCPQPTEGFATKRR
jgi:hypothetical protein